MAFQIIPTLDIKEGAVVRGVGGRREEYQLLASELTPSCQPAQVAQAFRDKLGLTELYVADLDAIGGAAPSLALYEELRKLDCRLWLDSGVRKQSDIERLKRTGSDRVIIGLETIEGPQTVVHACRQFDPSRLCFSLDMRSGTPLGNVDAWDRPDAWSIATQAISLGIRSIIVLDLFRIGRSTGTGTTELCRRLTRMFPHVEIVAGGGVRDVHDLRQLKDCGVQGVLVASALHDGRLSAVDVAELCRRES